MSAQHRVTQPAHAAVNATDPGARLSDELTLAFAPVHKRAFGAAVGAATGLLVFGVTAVYLLRGGHASLNLGLLAEYFYGYTVSWPGAFVGLAWGFAVGFVAGWFVAFCRNLAIVTSIWVLRTKSELAQTRDFLDHI
jgi:hypothetical protein